MVWDVPPEVHHELIRTPDLAPLLIELQSIEDIDERSTISLVMEPISGDGGRHFKTLFTLSDAILALTDDVFGYLMMLPSAYILLTKETLFQTSKDDGLLDPDPEEDAEAFRNKWSMINIFVWCQFCFSSVFTLLL